MKNVLYIQQGLRSMSQSSVSDNKSMGYFFRHILNLGLLQIVNKSCYGHKRHNHAIGHLHENIFGQSLSSINQSIDQSIDPACTSKMVTLEISGQCKHNKCFCERPLVHRQLCTQARLADTGSRQSKGQENHISVRPPKYLHLPVLASGPFGLAGGPRWWGNDRKAQFIQLQLEQIREASGKFWTRQCDQSALNKQLCLRLPPGSVCTRGKRGDGFVQYTIMPFNKSCIRYVINKVHKSENT